MEVAIKMPDLSTTGDEVTVLEWLVEPGQSIKQGEVLLTVETDKAVMEVESFASGILKTRSVQSGAAVSTGEVIAVVETEHAAVATAVPESDQSFAPAPQDAASVEPTTPPQTLSRPDSPARKSTGMFARNRQAAEQSQAVGTSSIALSVAQRTIARRMQESKQTAPHFYLCTSVNAAPMLARRDSTGNSKIAWDAFFVSAIGKALRTFPRLCFRFADGELHPRQTDAVGVAIDLDGELYVIPIANPASKTPEQISSEIRGAVERLRAADAELKRNHPANITITNLGMANIDSFIPIINPPESAILGIGKVAPQPVVVDGEIVIGHRVSLTLAVDHRVVNGRYAANFLEQIVKELESN